MTTYYNTTCGKERKMNQEFVLKHFYCGGNGNRPGLGVATGLVNSVVDLIKNEGLPNVDEAPEFQDPDTVLHEWFADSSGYPDGLWRILDLGGQTIVANLYTGVDEGEPWWLCIYFCSGDDDDMATWGEVSDVHEDGDTEINARWVELENSMINVPAAQQG